MSVIQYKKTIGSPRRAQSLLTQISVFQTLLCVQNKSPLSLGSVTLAIRLLGRKA